MGRRAVRMTPPPDKQPAAETLGEIAERLMLPAVGKVAPAIWNSMVHDALFALRNERERAAKVLDREIVQLRALRYPTSYAKWKCEELERLAEAIRGGK